MSYRRRSTRTVVVTMRSPVISPGPHHRPIVAASFKGWPASHQPTVATAKITAPIISILPQKARSSSSMALSYHGIG